MVEAIVVIAIILIIAAILTPVYRNARRGSEIDASISNMRQLYASLAIYRNDNEGLDRVYEYYALGPPPRSYYTDVWHEKDKSMWPSPCNSTAERLGTLLPTVMKYRGEISYSARVCEPAIFENGGNLNLKDYLSTYKQNAALFVDPYCNDAGIDRYSMSVPFEKKRALAMLLSGQLVNRIKKGNALYLQFYSSPPEER